ncbi:MAG: hypothetical protein IPP79_19050 [Chitinophagaceae bacterium]|nr:hypothetical protein [Chitinophagaceae bacterium]
MLDMRISAKNLPKGVLWSVAQVIWDSTGIEPVTVAQHEISEGYINSYKNFFYNYLIPKLKGPAILYMNGKPLDLSGVHMYDFSIITNLIIIIFRTRGTKGLA